jgi:hypothetical protein
MGSFDAKKPPSKISCLGTFKPAALRWGFAELWIIMRVFYE